MGSFLPERYRRKGRLFLHGNVALCIERKAYGIGMLGRDGAYSTDRGAAVGRYMVGLAKTVGIGYNTTETLGLERSGGVAFALCVSVGGRKPAQG